MVFISIILSHGVIASTLKLDSHVSGQWERGRLSAECSRTKKWFLIQYPWNQWLMQYSWLCASRTSIGVNTFMMFWAVLRALALGRALHKVFLGFFKIVRVLSDDERSSSFSLGLLNFI